MAFIGSPTGPSRNAFAITKSDATLFAATSAIWVGGAGNVVALLAGDTVPVTFTAVAAGTLLPISAVKVMAATSATALIGLA